MSEPHKSLPCDFEAELPLLLYQGELAREDRERLKSHLATCARCTEAFTQLEATAIALDGAMAVPKPTSQQWDKLKADVLARVAKPASAAETASSVSDVREGCESIEEDLLVLNEVGADRKKVVLAHLDECAACRETRSAFGSIGLVLNRQPLVWPSIERWDSLKESVLSTVDGEVRKTKESGRVGPPVEAKIVRTSWRMFSRTAAAVAALVAVTAGVSLLRGPTAEEVRRLYRDAQGSGELAVVTRSYELVVQKGIDKPECRTEVDDSLRQIQAIHQYERALSQPSPELKVVALRDVVLRYPDARVTGLALSKLNELAPPQPAPSVPKATQRSGFDEPGGPRFRVDKSFIQRYVDNLETQFVSLANIADENARKKKELEFRAALGAGYLQLAQEEHESRDHAVELYKKALDRAVPGSNAALEAKKQLDTLGGK